MDGLEDGREKGSAFGRVALEGGRGRGVRRCSGERLSGGWSHGGWLLLHGRYVRRMGAAAARSGARCSPLILGRMATEGMLLRTVRRASGGSNLYVPYCPLDWAGTA